MSNQPKKRSVYHNLVLIIFLAALVNGCALGVTRVNVIHDQLTTIENKRDGDILVKQFTDKRPIKDYIGNKRNMYGVAVGHIGTKNDIKIEELLTKYFAEALREAGYNVIIQHPQSTEKTEEIKVDAIIEGEINQFWLDFYMAVWHNVVVLVTVLDKEKKAILWEKEFVGNEKKALWVGAKSEYEIVIRQALTKALNSAVKEFASEEFYKNIRRERN